MESSFFHSTLTVVLIFQHFTTTLSTNPIPPTNSTNTDYIKTSCNITLYPQLCYNSLSPYAPKIKTSPKLLAITTLSLSLSAAHSASNAIKNISKITLLNPRETSAKMDCIEELSNSVYQIQRSIQELNHSGGSKSNFIREMSDVETWVSAALTDDDTCMDGFSGKQIHENIRIAVRSHILNVAHLTSIALALINKYAGT